MVADTAALIEKLVAAPARIVAVSMGSFIAQELMVARPELVSAAVLMATRGRLDRTREFFHAPRPNCIDSGIQLPPAYDAKIRLLESFSRKTLNDDEGGGDWIEMFTMWPIKATPGLRCQMDVAPMTNRLPAYRSIAAPVLVIGFADDVVTPPHLGRRSPTPCRTPAFCRYLMPGISGSSSGRRPSTPRCWISSANARCDRLYW